MGIDIFAIEGRGGRVAEGARLESVYTLTGYRGFESLSLRKKIEIKETSI